MFSSHVTHYMNQINTENIFPPCTSSADGILNPPPPPHHPCLAAERVLDQWWCLSLWWVLIGRLPSRLRCEPIRLERNGIVALWRHTRRYTQNPFSPSPSRSPVSLSLSKCLSTNLLPTFSSWNKMFCPFSGERRRFKEQKMPFWHRFNYTFGGHFLL